MQIKGYPPLSQRLELVKDNMGRDVQSKAASCPSSSSKAVNDVINLVEDDTLTSSFLIDSDEKFSDLVKPSCILSLRIYEQLFDDSTLV